MTLFRDFAILIIYFQAFSCLKLIYGRDEKCANSVHSINININIDDGTCDHQPEIGESNYMQSLASWCNLNRFKSENFLCESNPCLHGSSCLTNEDQSDYQCIDCPFPLGGKRCSELACNTTCFRLNQTVYFLYLDQPMTWTAAHEKCQQNNMTLAILKYRNIRHFLRIHLVNVYVYADDSKHQNKFWIGLNRSSHSGPWKWMDGTQLGKNNEWFDNKLRNENCAIINIERYFKIEQSNCDNKLMYPLCQQNYTFLIN